MQFFKLIGKNHQTQVSDCLSYGCTEDWKCTKEVLAICFVFQIPESYLRKY